MDKKEKGSALILAILILTFFMALTMNMYYMAQKKSERAGIKSKGIKSLGEINFGTALGMYEYRLSQWFEQGVTEGAIVLVAGVDDTSDELYNVTNNYNHTIDNTLPAGLSTGDNVAIRMSDFSNFFTSLVTRASISTTDDAGMERIYENTNTTISSIAKISVGGYNVSSLSGTAVKYLKKIRIVGTEVLTGTDKNEIQNMEYNLKYTETVTTTGTAINSSNAEEINAERITN